MELQALLVLCGAGVVGVAVILLMGLFSTSGTSYEEAIAQQRRATTELLALADNKNKPKKSNKKAIKKLKKEKNKEAALATASEPESEAPAESGVEDEPTPAPKPHVEFSPPVVVDVPRENPPNVKVQEKTEEVLEKKENKSAKAPKTGKAAPKPAPVVEAVKEEVVRTERQNTGEAPKDQRKAKKVEKKAPTEEVVEAVPEEIVPPLNAPQPSELTTDKLLKQALVSSTTPPANPSPPGGKNKKKKNEPNVLTLMAGDSGGVHVGELVRVVREAALSRTEIQILTDALLNKHHDPLPDHSEWSEGSNDPIQKLKKLVADKDKAMAESTQALQAKIKELRTMLNAERTRAAAGARAGEQAAAAARAELHTQQARLQRLLDDNHALANDKHILQTKLSTDLEAQAQARAQMEMHIQRLSESEAALIQQLNALQVEFNAHVQEIGQLRMEVGTGREAIIMAQQHATELAAQLQEANRAYGEVEQKRQEAVHAEQKAQEELRIAQEQLGAITELQNEIQRLTARVQVSESNAEKIKEDADNENKKLSSELSSLGERLAEREAELAEIKQLKAVPAQNGLPTSNANDEHKVAVESVVEPLRAELADAQRASRDQRELLARLQAQLAHYQDKNNEAIAKAQEAQYKEVASVLRAVCPNAAPSDAAGHDWLQTFAANLKKELEAKQPEREVAQVITQTAAPPTDDRVKDLLSHNEQLKGLVDKYKRIIDDTEGALSHLQQNVSAEEQRWAQQLADKQRELDELNKTKVLQMQKTIDSLEAELSQAKANSHNHSFADAERQAEEKLMAGFSEKHNLDPCNGPLQVGLEEKK